MLADPRSSDETSVTGELLRYPACGSVSAHISCNGEGVTWLTSWTSKLDGSVSTACQVMVCEAVPEPHMSPVAGDRIWMARATGKARRATAAYMAMMMMVPVWVLV